MNLVTASRNIKDHAILATFEDVEKLIYQICHKMAARYKIPFEDIVPQAKLIYMKSYHDFDPDKACFTTYIYRRMHWGLTDYLIEEYRARDYDELNEQIAGCENHPRSAVHDIEMLVSAEARVVIQLVVDTPEHLQALLRWNRAEGSKKIQSTFREYLKEELGWESVDVSRCFNEIRTALSSRV